MNDFSLPNAPIWVRYASAVTRRLPAGRYRFMNWFSRTGSPVFVAQIGRRQGGRQYFECDLRDSISREVCFTGRYEPQETVLVNELVGAGDVFVDVGANWGYFTLLAADRTGPDGRVISLEPDPRLFPILCRNVGRNNYAHVSTLQIAAADRAGVMHLAGFDESGGNFGVSRLVLDGDAAGDVAVPVCRLDDLLDELGIQQVALLKMDIEGAEGMAIAGLSRVLAERRVSRLLLELHPPQLSQLGSSAATVVQCLANSGYRPWRINHTPQANRRAAYAKNPRVRSFLEPLSCGATLDDWPHVLWVAPHLDVLP